MVFQNYNLFLNKTVLENVTEGLLYGKKLDESKANKIAFELLEDVGMYDKKDKYPVTLSGGEKQRVGIARALALDPELILFDEPTSALDPEKTIGVLETIKRSTEKGNFTAIIVTHEMKFAKEVSDNILMMEAGEVVEISSPEQIFTNPKSDRTKQFINAFAIE